MDLFCSLMFSGRYYAKLLNGRATIDATGTKEITGTRSLKH